MGIFGKIIGGTKDNQHIAEGVSNVQRLLHDYELSKDDDYLIMAAYITRLAVLDTFEKSGYNVANICYANIDGRLTKLSWLQANMMTYGKIIGFLNSVTYDVKEFVESILEKEEAFYEIDKTIPYDKKKIFID